MALTITLIDPNDPVSSGPSVINQNLTAIKAVIDSIQGVLNDTDKTLKLTTLTTVAAGSMEASAAVFTKGSGDVLMVNPSAGGVVWKVDSNGVSTGLKFVATGTGVSDISTFKKSQFDDDMTVNGDITVNGKLKLTGTDAILVQKYGTFTIVDANTGASASTPLDISKAQIVHLNCNNSGSSLANSGAIKLDTSNFTEGQIWEIHLLRKNTGGQKFYNGTSGNEIFAFIDANGSGYTTISSSTMPTFAPSTSPDNQSWMKCQWCNIGGGVYRMVVLDSVNVTGVV